VLLIVTLTGFWGVPELVKTATQQRGSYPFVYFSSIEKKFMLRQNEGKQSRFFDDTGKEYTEDEYDHALPLFNYRQLTVNGEMPDSIDGIAIDPRELRIKLVNFRYLPAEIHTPQVGLYIMYESMPKKAKLETPGDVFRLDDKIEFIDDQTNTIEKEKSQQFQNALIKAGYTFPAQWTYGNLSIRKPYDEGYFSLDSDGQLFHIKMVNARPFVRNALAGDTIQPLYFSMLEVADKRFYGFIIDRRGSVYILEEGYNPVRLDIDAINPDADAISLIGNMLYWTVTVQTPTGRRIYALDTETLSRQRFYEIPASEDLWNKASGLLFPANLTFKEKNSDYVSPRLHFTGFKSLIISVFFTLIIFGYYHIKRTKFKYFAGIFTLIFGLAGFLALLIVPRE
jgi:hypothetical protein